MRIPFMPLTFALLFSIFIAPMAYAGKSSGGVKGIKSPSLITVFDDFKVDEYYKFGVGSSWTYKKTVTHGNTDNGMVMYSTFDSKVTKVTDKEVFMGSMALYVSGDYLMAGVLQEDGKTVIDNLRVMKTGMKAGDSWDGMAAETSEEVKATFVAIEDLEIPAGKFKAVHVRYAGNGATMDFWHVAKVGMVKLSIKADNFASEQVLQKYTIK